MNQTNQHSIKIENYFKLTWRHLNYTIHNPWSVLMLRKIQGFKNTPKSKTVLRDINGTVKSGELVAFMGPSGAGKSTLMECVVGRRAKGRTGDIFISGDNLDDIKVAFIPQKNTFLSKLTVRETIYFAAQIQNKTKLNEIIEPLIDSKGNIITGKSFNDYCRIITDRIISDLNLQVCENNRVNYCSGGELKRIAIAQEIVGNPRILVLDEPTSGLDSASTFQLIKLLKNLCDSRLQITAFVSIHQPSYKVLNLFHKLYVLSSKGDIVYADSPSLLVNSLNSVGIDCPSDKNPSDLLLEVASGEYGNATVISMVEYFKKTVENEAKMTDNCKQLNNRIDKFKFPDLKHTWILSKRFTLITVRDPIAFCFRFLNCIGVPFFFMSLFGSEVGIRGGCPPKFDADFEPSQLDYIIDEINAESDTTFFNTGNMIASLLLSMFNSLMTTLLCFPQEMVVFKNEKNNYWYSNRAFFFGKTLSEIPFQLFFAIFYWPIQHILQNQIPEFWRVASVTFIMLLTQFIHQTFGYIIGATFMYNTPAAIFLGPAAVLLISQLLCGLYVKIKNLNDFFYLISHFESMRFATEGLLVSIYGFNRCEGSNQDLKNGRDAFVVWMSAMLGLYGYDSDSLQNSTNITEIPISSPSEKFVEELIDAISSNFIGKNEEVRSMVMNDFELKDSYLYRTYFVMIIYLIVLRVLAYIIIAAKARSKD